MKLNVRTLRFRFYAWYLGSLIVLSIYFYVIVHLLMLPHSDHIFLLLLLIMGLTGFGLIYKITSSLTNLSSQIKSISFKNLDKRVKNISGGEELEVLAHSFNHVLDNLDDTFNREQQFIGDLAHELKTPLATLRTTFEVALSKQRTTDEYTKIIEESLKDTTNLSSTLENVLDLAWAETPHEQKHPHTFNLSELIEEIADITQKMAIAKQIIVENNIEKEIYITGFKEKLARALINIVENAVNYTQKGTIFISLKRQDSQIVIIIQDSGLGIAKEDIPHIFERFYRGNKTNKIFGSGLGLAITKSSVNLHRGDIHVDSKVSQGTIFTVILPLI